MTIEQIVAARGISEILHFTRHPGLCGVLHTKYVKSRKRLEEDNELKYIFEPNAKFRKDHAWLDYVNLSISEINGEFFGASQRWHQREPYWWCILAFDPIILSHDGVFFANTNNFYTGVIRDRGERGLEMLFAETIERWNNNLIARPNGYPGYLPTCDQAEVLYPDQLSTKYLRKIYVMDDEDKDDVSGQFAGLFHDPVPIVVDKAKFYGVPK